LQLAYEYSQQNNKSINDTLQLVFDTLSYEETPLELHALANEAIEYANTPQEEVNADKYPNYAFMVELNRQVDKLVGVDDINRRLSFMMNGMSS
jgi:hypothetical protein